MASICPKSPWQTDNGSEFPENKLERRCPRDRPQALGSRSSLYPKRYTGKVTSKPFTASSKTSSFDLETFTGILDWTKITTYWHYFNLVRPNRGKEWQKPSPNPPKSSPGSRRGCPQLATFNLTKRHNAYLPKPYNRGHDLPSFP